MAFLQQVMCPNNMARSGDQEQVCFTNYNELHGVRRGTIFGVNANSLNRWKYAGQPAPQEQFAPPPFDLAGMTNHQVILEKANTGVTSPNDATEAQRALGAMRCPEGTHAVWRGSAFMRTSTGEVQPVSIWQCEVTGTARDRMRTRSMLYA